MRSRRAVIVPTGSGLTEVSSDTSPQLGADLDAQGFTILDLEQILANSLDLGTQAAAISAVLTASMAQHAILSGNAVITVSGEAAGMSARTFLALTQDGTGGRVPTWSGVDVWIGGQPVIDGTIGATTVVELFSIGTTVYGVGANAISATIGTAAGDLIGFTASGVAVRIPVGATNGLPLVVDTTQAAKVAYAGQKVLEINTQAGAYTLVLGDAGKSVHMSATSSVALTVPPNSSVAFPVGTVVNIAATGAGGTITITQGAGVTIAWLDGDNTSGTGNKAIAGQYGVVSLLKTATDTWLLSGALAA